MTQVYVPRILGVLNVSPESMVRDSIAAGDDEIEARARKLAAEGADWIDVGGRSITPEAAMIDDVEEQSRLRPALRILAEIGHPISVDTWSEATARFALEAGAGAINFTGGSIGSDTLDAIAARSALLFLTFMPYGDAYRMREAPLAPIGIQPILDHLGPRVEAARRAGIEQVVIDPNVGIVHPATDDYSKIHQQLEIVWNLDALRVLGCPILLYAARKPERLARIMMASCVIHAKADYIRSHDPAMIEQLRHVRL
jgi:dihydropteroate synthase